jgi:hypothetical protein
MKTTMLFVTVISAMTIITRGYAEISSGLIAHYKLDGNALDSSGAAKHGTIMNTPYFADGPVGQSIHLQGRNHTGSAGDHVRLPYFNFSTYSAFSIALWVKWDADAGIGHGEGFFSAGCHCGSGLVGIGAYGESPNYNISFTTGTKGGDTRWQSSYWSKWKHLALVYQAGVVRGYVDGVLMVNSNVGTVVGQGNTNVGMGIHWWSGSPDVSTRFIGSLDDVRLYNRALTSTDIGQLYALRNNLSAISIGGASTISEGYSASFPCTAQFSDGSTADVATQSACSWSIVGSAPSGTRFSGNTLFAGSVSASTPITIKATYSSGGQTRSATKTVTVQPRFKASILEVGSSYNSGTFKWTVNLAASTMGPNGSAVSYAWDLDNDGQRDDSTTANPATLFSVGETRLITLAATDSAGSIATAKLYIAKGQPPVANEPPATEPPVSAMIYSLLNVNAGAFSFDSARKANGLLVIVHGLTDSATSGWASEMGQAVNARLGAASPNIVLFDWSNVAADPGSLLGAGIPGLGNDPADLIAIRLLGAPMGLLLGSWIADHIRSGDIDSNAPIQIIGHSAGGFVAGSSACLLPLAITQITMLDTPLPYAGLPNWYLPLGGLVEQYKTSYGFGAGSWVSRFPQGMYWTDNYSPYTYPGWNEGHNWVHDWYTDQTISPPSFAQNGFYYSPFMNNGFHGHSPASLLARSSPKPLDAGTSLLPISGFSVFGTVVNVGEVYTVTESANAGIVKTVALPIGVQNLQFRYQFTSPGDGDFMAVYWGTNEAAFVGLDLPISRSNAVDGIVSLSDFAGQTNTIMFKLVSRSNVNAVVVIDGIGLEISDDPDNDGLTNDQEASLGTDPQKGDSDGDGISDGDEVNTYHSNPLNPDSDNDGMRDGAEVHSGTSPTNELDRLAIIDIGTIGTAGPTIKWQSVTGKSYRVNRWTNLVEDSYTTVTNTVPAISDTNTFTDSTATNGPMFYWIELDE